MWQSYLVCEKSSSVFAGRTAPEGAVFLFAQIYAQLGAELAQPVGQGVLGVKAGDLPLRRVQHHVQRLPVGLLLHAGHIQIQIKMLLADMPQFVLQGLLLPGCFPQDVFEQYKERLPDNWQKRAEHWYSEQERVECGVDAWRRGDIEEYGRLSFESGKSSIENWETGSPELKKLYEIMTVTDGIYGGRFSGAGFKGCCMALIDPVYEESIKEKADKLVVKANELGGHDNISVILLG